MKNMATLEIEIGEKVDKLERNLTKIRKTFETWNESPEKMTNELGEAKMAIKAYLRDNDLDEKETEFTLILAGGPPSIQGNLKTILSAIRLILEDSNYWILEVFDQNETRRAVIVILRLNEDCLWRVAYAYPRDQKSESEEEEKWLGQK